MQSKTEGIVLRTIKYGENQLIVDILTKDFGMKTYMIYGARSSKSKKKGLYNVPNILGIDALHRENKSMDRILDETLSYTYQTVPFDFYKMSTAMFISELSSKVLRKSDATATTFDFISKNLKWLDSNSKGFQLLPIHFMISWVGEHGIEFHLQEQDWFPYFDFYEGKFMPHQPNHRDFIEGDDLALFKSLVDVPLDELGQIKSKRESRNVLLDQLIRFYRHNIEGLSEVKSVQVLREII